VVADSDSCTASCGCGLPWLLLLLLLLLLAWWPPRLPPLAAAQGTLEPLDGMVKRHNHLRIGQYHQHLTELLDGELTPLEYMMKGALPLLPPPCLAAGCSQGICLAGWPPAARRRGLPLITSWRGWCGWPQSLRTSPRTRCAA